MARKSKYPVTGRDTPIPEILAVLALSALIIVWATLWRVSGVESWMPWLAAALFPGVLLRWFEIVRRTRWLPLEIAAGVLAAVFLIWGYVRVGGWILGIALAIGAALLAWLAWRRFSGRS